MPTAGLCQSQWPRRLMRRSVAARLLGLKFRILCGQGCLSLVSVARCQAEVVLITRPEESYQVWCV